MAGSIKKDIKTNEYTKIYLVFGEEEFLRDYYKNALIEKTVDKSLADFNFKKFTSQKPDNDEVESFFSSYPFMSEKKVLYIKNSGIFKKTSEDDKKFWQRMIDEIPDFGIIIFSEKEVDKRNALYKAVNAKFSCDEFPFQKTPELASWIVRYMAKYDKNISDADAEYMIECCSRSMYILKSEIEKLAFYKEGEKFITRQDIDRCVCKLPESRVFRMIDDILDGNIKDAGERLAELKLLKEEPIALNSAIFSKYSQLRREKMLSKTLTPREIASKTGQRDYFVNMHLKQIKDIPIEKLDEIINACQSLDYRVKSGLADAWTELEVLFAKMCMIKPKGM